MRKRMNIRPSRENLNILLVGTAQHIQGAGGIPLPRHHTTIERLVTEMCETGRIAAVTDMPTRNYLYIGMNRSVRTMVANAETGQRFATCSSNRPDILGVWRDAQGRIGVDMFEVRSGTQGGETLLTHLRNTITTLPQDIVQGTYRVLESD